MRLGKKRVRLAVVSVVCVVGLAIILTLRVVPCNDTHTVSERIVVLPGQANRMEEETERGKGQERKTGRDWEVAQYTEEETDGWRGLGVRGLEAGVVVSGDLVRLMRAVRKGRAGKPITFVGLGSSVMANYGGTWVDQDTDSSPDVAAYVKWRRAENVYGRSEKGGGWAKSVLDLFNASWPHPHHRLINAGFDAVGVGGGPCGCWSMVHMPSTIDIVLLEWTTIPSSPEVSEGCLRFLLGDQDAAVIVVSNDYGVPTEQSAPLVNLARHYNVPVVSNSGWHHAKETLSLGDLFEYQGDIRTPHPNRGLGNTHLSYWAFHPIARAAAEVARMPLRAALPPSSVLPPSLSPEMVPVHTGPCFHARAHQLIAEGAEINLHDLLPSVIGSFSSKLVQWRGPFSWKRAMSFVNASSFIRFGLVWPHGPEPQPQSGDLVLSFVHSWSPAFGSVQISCPNTLQTVCTCPVVNHDLMEGSATVSARLAVPLTYVSTTATNSNQCIVHVSRLSPPRCKEKGDECGQTVYLQSLWVDFEPSSA